MAAQQVRIDEADGPALMALHLVSDAIIAIAYFSIPVVLAFFWRRYPKMPFRWIFSMIGVSMTLCGWMHLADIWTIWHPAYWRAEWVEAATAAASLATVVALIALIPQILRRNPAQLAEESAEHLEFVQWPAKSSPAPQRCSRRWMR